MLVVVTGSSGRLGKVVVRDLLDHGFDVRPVDQHPATESDGPLTCLADLRNAADLTQLFKGADAVCHLGNAPAIRDFPLTDGFTNNVAATHSVFEAAAVAGVRRIVNASSIQAYGIVTNRAEVKPSPPVYLPIDEDHPLLPRDAYPLSKAMSEWIAESFVRLRPELSVFSLRFTHITDRVPADAGRESIGGALLTAVHPADAALAVRLCCSAESRGHVPLNIVMPQATVPWELQWIRDYYGIDPEIRGQLKPTDALITGRRAEKLIGFAAHRIPAAPAAQ
jgi:nucleoside-diphosphate-sugar epimerase